MSETKTSTSEELERAAAYLDRLNVRLERAQITSGAQQAALRDAYTYGTGFALDGKHVPAELVPMSSAEIAAEQATKTSSPGLATLAAQYINLDELNLEGLSPRDAKTLAADVRALAASVLSQAAPK